jgi:tetratricopeptide (TPR) repeat protein
MGAEFDLAALPANLRDHLGHRRIEPGIQMLEGSRALLDTLGPRPGCGILTGLLAQWVDAGFDQPALLRRILEKFPKLARAELPLLDYLHLRMADAVLAMSNEDFESALRSLLLVQSFEGDVADGELLAIANFWAGRCFRRMGRYSEALKYTERGEALALSRGYAEMAALTRMTRSWLAFQKGKLQEANDLLRTGRRGSGPHQRLSQPRQYPVGIRPYRSQARQVPARAGVLRASYRRIPR